MTALGENDDSPKNCANPFASYRSERGTPNDSCNTSQQNSHRCPQVHPNFIQCKPELLMSTTQRIHRIEAFQGSTAAQPTDQSAASTTALIMPRLIQVPSCPPPAACVSQADNNTGATKKEVKPKKVRTNLRKGKWTVEEEEYTTRIIHHFTTGVLTLPEGTTLRSYLAEKLNCDPMRITKKFAGASCLGKRVYHLCDKSQATAAEIEMSKHELSHLEHRFRLRAEHGQSGVPPPNSITAPPVSTVVPPVSGMLFSSPPIAPPIPNWITAVQPGVAPLVPNFPQPQPAASQVWTIPLPHAPIQFSFAPPQMQTSANPASHTGNPSQPVSSVPFSQNPTSMMSSAANDAITSWAWAQAAAALQPALSQLAAANFQQHQQQLQKAYQAQMQVFSSQVVTVPEAAPPLPAPSTMAPPPHVLQINVRSTPIGEAVHSTILPSAGAWNTHLVTPSLPVVDAKPRTGKHPESPTREGRTKEDEDAGTMLMGFLSSLREGYMEAISQKDKEEDNRKHPNKRTAPSKGSSLSELASTDISSGSTSHPAESSLEDSGSDKGKEEVSSSDDSDKDTTKNLLRGPPRKRIKMHKISDFTSQNVAMHNRAMTALHGNQNGYKQQMQGRPDASDQRN